MSHDATPLVLQAMVGHASHAVVLRECCCALRNIATSYKTTGLVIAAGGVVSIADAMSACPDDPEVQAHACAALRNMAFAMGEEVASRHEAIEIIRTHALRQMVGAMRHHPEAGAVQVQACGAFRNMSLVRPVMCAIIKVGA